MFYKNGLPKTRDPQKGDSLSNGRIVTDTEFIKAGVLLLTFDDNTERVYLSAYRLHNAPDEVELDECLADIQDFEQILAWYDIEWSPFDAFTGEYRYKPLTHENCAEQCWLEVTLKNKSTKRWSAVCGGEMGEIERITTDDGVEIKNLAELRYTAKCLGIIRVALISEYNIVDL